MSLRLLKGGLKHRWVAGLTENNEYREGYWNRSYFLCFNFLLSKLHYSIALKQSFLNSKHITGT